MESKKTRIGGYGLLILMVGLLVFSGCASVVFDKKAVGKMKKVAVLLYTVPSTIEYYDDPKERKKSLLQIAAAVVSANNGEQAATTAQRTFIEELNRQKLGFTAISQAEMMSNGAFLEISKKWVATRMAEKAAAEKKKSGAMKALSILSSIGGGKKKPVGVGPKGLPEFGLAQNWSAGSALIGGSAEFSYIKNAIAALGVDGAIIINDQGFSFSCKICVGGTGKGGTHTAFLISIVDRNGGEVLGMREWFNSQPRSAAMVGYVVNPLQHNSLFEGHGIKTAIVFANLFRKESKK